jgi:hypothetical protein
MSGGQLIGFFAVVGGTLVAICTISGALWTGVRFAELRARRVELEAGLKRDMLARGMSAEEIERVLAAGQPKTSSCSSARAPRPEPAGHKSCV